MAVCNAWHPGVAFNRADPLNLTISDATKRPIQFVSLKPGDVFLAVAQPEVRIHTSPGQIFFNNGTWGPAGNGRPAGGDWLIPEQSEFAVSFRIGTLRQIIGHKTACIRWPGGTITTPVEFGLNVVQEGWGSPLTNRWAGSIGVRFMHFRAST